MVCSCPDGDRQRDASRISKKLYVCKHGKAALDSVIDTATQDKSNAERKQRAAKAAHKGAEQHQKYIEEQRTIQNRDMPGERERIEYGLSKRSDRDIVNLIKGASKTVEGLEALTKIFPKEVMPTKRTVICGRCEKEYDPQVSGDDICRE